MIGFFIRREACKMAAIAMQGDCKTGDVANRLWSLATFFELFMRDGSNGTLADFGPKEPVKLERVS